MYLRELPRPSEEVTEDVQESGQTKKATRTTPASDQSTFSRKRASEVADKRDEWDEEDKGARPRRNCRAVQKSSAVPEDGNESGEPDSDTSEAKRKGRKAGTRKASSKCRKQQIDRTWDVDEDETALPAPSGHNGNQDYSDMEDELPDSTLRPEVARNSPGDDLSDLEKLFMKLQSTLASSSGQVDTRPENVLFRTKAADSTLLSSILADPGTFTLLKNNCIPARAIGEIAYVLRLLAFLDSVLASSYDPTQGPLPGPFPPANVGLIDFGSNKGSVMTNLKDIINEMKSDLKEKLGGQAVVPGVEGVWFELVRNVNHQRPPSEPVPYGRIGGKRRVKLCLVTNNAMSTTLPPTINSLGPSQHSPDPLKLVVVLTDQLPTAHGDLTQKIEIQVKGKTSTLKGTVNSMVDQLSAFASDVTRVALEKMASNLTAQVRPISKVTKAVAMGDLSKLVDVDRCWTSRKLESTSGVTRTEGDGEESLNLFAVEVTRVARETAGDLTQKITGVSIFGEIVNTINDMIDQLAIFAAEVKKIAREAGTEGKPGVQAEVSNVPYGRRLPAMDGDFTRFITVEAFGDSMDSLKMQINQMVFNLWDSIQKNTAARRVSL
ncbi:hypothetical protein JOM56_003004 [Amanita muscaria]